MKRYHLFMLAFISLIAVVNLKAQTISQKVSVAYSDCGNPDSQAFLVEGQNYTFGSELSSNIKERTCNFGKKVIYAFDKINIKAHYQLKLVFLADQDREIAIMSDGNAIADVVELQAGKRKELNLDIPAKAYAYGQLVLAFVVEKGPNAVVSELELFSSDATPLKPLSFEKKKAISNKNQLVVTEKIDVQSVLPTLVPRPSGLKGVYEAQISLNGVWKFNEKPESDFYKESKPADWKNIVVPGQWSMQGFKVDSAAYAGYFRTFSIPQDWKGKQTKLRFDGVSSECTVWLNGQEAAHHLGGMTAFEIDITPYITSGENRLALKVRNESLADMLGSLTQYAAHQLGGITRKVSLFAVPEVNVSDLRVVTDLDDDYRNATLKVQASIHNQSPVKSEPQKLRISLEDIQKGNEFLVPAIEAGGKWTSTFEIEVTNPRKWTNETPNLYELNVELIKTGITEERITKKIGFREVEVRGSELLVNGVSVKLRGVNRHEASPLGGRVLNRELWEKDLDLYLQGNCNFIRTSHYPPAEEFIAMCDEKGIFVEMEAPVCWVGHHANKNWRHLNYKDEKYFPYILQANMETIQFYRNHPSILFWSMANESYWNYNFAKLQEYVKKADTSRPHAFHDQGYGEFNNQGSTAPISNIHYPGANGYKMAASIDRPLVYGEYCHLNVYNRRELVTDPGVRNDWASALSPTWDNMYATKGILGGAIWSGIDDIFQMPDGTAVGYGPWGPVDSWRRPKPEYWHMKKIYSPVRVLTRELEPAEQLRLSLENRYSFTNLKDVRIKWSFGEESGALFPDIAPGEKGNIVIDIQDPSAGHQLTLEFMHASGFLVDEFVIPVGHQFQNEIAALQPVHTSLKKTRSQFVIKAKMFECRVDRQTGQIISVIKDGDTLLNGGPWLMALPLDGEGCEPHHNANTPPFNELCKNWKAREVVARKTSEGVEISVKGAFDEFEGAYTMLINGSGAMHVDYAFESKLDVNPRQWGLVFDAPKQFDELFWSRKGLWTCYPQDHIGRTSGKAPSFYEGVPLTRNPRQKPLWNWSCDPNPMGCSDFRSTRRNIWFAGLENDLGQKITVVNKEASQHWRCWIHEQKVQFLVAGFVTGGNELFLGGFYAPTRKPLKKGDVIKDKILIHLGK
jgi:beta-galactosidase